MIRHASIQYMMKLIKERREGVALAGSSAENCTRLKIPATLMPSPPYAHGPLPTSFHPHPMHTLHHQILEFP